MRVLMTLAAGALLASTPAFAGDPQAAPNKKDDGNKIVCISEEVVGSRISQRICHTRDEWQARRDSDKQALDRNMRNGRGPEVATGSGG